MADQITLGVDDGGVIHIKTVEPHGDPVELNEHEAGELVDVLQEAHR